MILHYQRVHKYISKCNQIFGNVQKFNPKFIYFSIDDEIKPTDQLTFTKAPEETNEIKVILLTY